MPPRVDKSSIVVDEPKIDIAPIDPNAKPFDLTELDAMIKESDPGSVDLSAPRLCDDTNTSPAQPGAVLVDSAVAALIDSLRVEINELRAQVGALPGGSTEGIMASTIGQAYCSICGLRLDGGSATGIQGQLYEHPFVSSPKLGTTCKYIGRKFKPPVVFLELVPKPERR